MVKLLAGTVDDIAERATIQAHVLVKELSA